MLVDVFHFHTTNQQLMGELFFRPNVKVVAAAYNSYVPGIKYVHVASVNANDLEDAFDDTNHIDYDWTENKNVSATDTSKRNRSTSVGDVMVVDGKKYMVDSIGFVEFV